MKSYVTFFKKPKCNEYLVMNKKKQILGDIAKLKKDWKFYPTCSYMDDIHDLWFTADCLQDIVNFMQALNGGK